MTHFAECATALDALTAPVTVLVGHFGAGKTELAVNLALGFAARGETVSLVDADLVKPYFRSRLLRDELGDHGVQLVAPHGDQFYADLPILVPEFAGAFGQAEAGLRRVIVDAGGADVGARVLGAVGGLRNPAITDVLFVVNGNRPFAEDVPSIVKMLREVEHASKLRVNGLVANTHLMGETTPAVIATGLELADAVSREVGLAVRFWAAMAEMVAADWQGLAGCDWPLLSLDRRITPPIDRQPPGGRRRSSVL
jgi:RecA/RadA recombinase